MLRSLRKDDDGNPSVEFDGGILRAREDSSAFISEFDNGELVISAGNLFIDSNGFTVTVSSPLTGTGGLYKIGSGTTILTADSSGVSGLSQVQNGTLTVNGILGGSMEVRNGRLQGTGQVGDTDNFSDGTIAPGNSIGTLTIAGNYVGHDGTLEIETVLGGDDSETDLLVITGDTSGNTFVKVINLGGSGGQTTEGIKIVDVGGASNGTFSLNGDFAVNGEQAVVGGAYYYVLQQNGIGANSSDGDWYLRSRGLSPAAPVYESYPQVIVPLIGLSTLHQRVGARYWESAQGQTADMASSDVSPAGRTGGAQDGIWTRIEGGHGRHTPTESTTNAQYDSDGWKMQSGIDGMVLNTSSGKLISGITVHY
ncbi:autotransporter outer membrane beta-barrel domain-containing protein, partial [Pseudidiomarina aestuarii]